MQKIKNIAILGGGTAGWLVANHLGLLLSNDEEIKISLIESSEIPPIGVGEGTVPLITETLKKFGIGEAEFLVSCDATFKQGIKFVNWLDSDKYGTDHFYYHPFEAPYPDGFDISPHLINNLQTNSFDDVGIQARVCELNLAPKLKSSKEYEGVLSYAYHFDAAKFATLLKKNACDRFGVKSIQKTITDAILAADGSIEGLRTSDNEFLHFDFFIDCSGFAALLIDKALKVPFISKAEELITDKALVHQVPLENNERIKPYTTATAHDAGWIWDIPLTTRRGTGFVYSSKHMSKETALASYAKYLNIAIEGFAPREIDMTVGFREKFWVKNCVAFGLAQGFVEPLEATSILLTDFSAELLAKNFPQQLSDIDVLSDYFNSTTHYAWERVTDFIKLHYCISDRTDTSFWVENKNLSNSSSELKMRLNKFKVKHPQQSDFFSRFDMFDEKNFLYVLYGMKYETRSQSISEREEQLSKKLLQRNAELITQAKESLLDNRTWLEGLKHAMMRHNAS